MNCNKRSDLNACLHNNQQASCKTASIPLQKNQKLTSALQNYLRPAGGTTLARSALTNERAGPSEATGRQSSIAIVHQKNSHGARSLATVAKGVCLHHEHYLTS